MIGKSNSRLATICFHLVAAFTLVVVCSFNSMAQIAVTVTGNTNTVPTLAASYTSLANAITDLNLVTSMTGAVTFNLAAGGTESVAAQQTITTAGNASFAITFQKSGAGANPILTRTDAGTNATSVVGGLGDGIIRIDGTDNIHFNGLDVTASNQGIEYGYYTHKPSATNACQTLSIMNCAITMTKGTSAYVAGIHIGNGSVSVSSATGVVVSANSGRTENVTITGNTISNVHMGIYCRGYSTAAFYDQNFVIGSSGAGNANTIQNFGGGSATTTYGVYFIYTNNANVDYNTINNAGGGGTAHASTLYGVFYSTVSGVVTGNNNNITLNSNGTSAVQGLYNSNTCTSLTFNNNTFAGSIASTSTSYLIYASSATNNVTATGNVTSGTILKTGASGLLYGYYNFGSPTGGTATISSNNFSNITLSGTSGFTGIRQASAVLQTANVTANTISNIICPGAFIGIEYTYSPGDCNNNIILNITGGAAVTGMLIGNTVNTGTSNIYNNNISAMSSTGASTVAGIQSAATAAGNILNYYKNIICSLSGSNASSTVYGLSITGGKTVNAYNNLIGHLTAPAATGTDAIRGISITATTTLSNMNISYNTIYLNATGAGNFGSSGLFHTTNATATTCDLTMRNNIIYNNSTPSGTGVTAAYRRSSTTNTNYNALSNRNLFWGGSPGASQLIFTNGTNSYDQLANYQAYIITQDQNSQTENVVWENTTCGHADFLKYDDATASAAESGAANIAGITTDVNNTIRQGNGGYAGTGSAPDIGAWELEGALPGCGTPALANAQTSNANPCNNATITLSLDVVYGVGHTYQWEESTVSAGGPYNTIGGANGATYVTGTSQTRWYRCIVTCVSSTISTTSVEVQVTIATPLNGTYVIDNTGGGDYLTFAAAIADLSCLGVSGPVTFNVIAGQTFVEASNLFCTFTGTSTNTITFQRTGAGANPKIQRVGTAATTDYILRLLGVDYYTFNGIDFEQTGTSATDWVEYGVLIQNGSATNGSQFNTIKNGVITLAIGNGASYGVYVQSSPTPTAASGTNSDNKFLNMDVGFCKIGYNITGATATFNDNNNEINTELGGTSTIHDIGDGIAAGSTYGIFSSYQSNFKIKNTDISNVLGTSTTLVYGITLQSSASNSADISGNNVTGVSGGGTTYGIYISSAATVDIYDNNVESIFTATATSSSVRGIYVTATAVTSNIYNNRVHVISSAGLTTTTAAGIDVGTGTLHNIYNNMISDITAPSSTTTTGGTRGISVTGGTAVRIYYNSVYMNDVGTVAGYTSAGIHNSSTTPTLDIRNNVVSNESDVTIGTRAVAFWKTAATDNVDVTCNNNLYYAGTPGVKNLIYYDGTNSIQTISAYQGVGAIAPAENLSQTEDVTWQAIVNGVLRPDAVVPTVIESGAATIAGYTTDFEADTRNATTPDMGADEGTFTIYVPPVPDCATYDAPADLAVDVCSYGTVTLDWTAAITGGSVTLGYDVYFGTNPIPPFVTNVSPSNYSPAGILPNTTYYWKIVPKNASGDAVGCLTYSFTTINAEVTSAAGDTRCGPGTVNLTASGGGTFNWYTAASGGSPVATGSPYSPSVVGTTNYWVSASDGVTNGNVGPLSPSIGTGASSTIIISTQQLFFNVLAPSMTINTVTVFPTATIGSSFTIVIQNSSAVQVFSSGPILTTVTGGATPQVVTLNAVLPAGTGYRFGFSTNPGMIRNSTGAVYPYTLPGVVSITGNSFDVNYYYFFYNWSVSTGCESPRTMVTATVETPATAIAGSDQYVCSGSTYTMAGSFGGSATSATWSTAGDGSFDNTSLMNAVYTPGATDISNGSVVLTLTTDDPAGVCTAASDNMTLTINPNIVVNGTVTDETCIGANDGEIDISISGGTGPFTCSWNGPTMSVIVVPKTAAHPYFGVGSGNGFEIDGTEGKELTLVRGVTYTFSINSPGHPLYISTDADGAGAGEVLAGVTGSQMDFGILTFTPNAGHPNLLYYQCFNHMNMGWKINIIDGITNCDLTGLMPGDYDVTVTDAMGCLGSNSFTVDAGVVSCCTPPVISACPSNISQCDVYTATWTDPTATGTSPTVTCVPASGSTFAAGTTTVTCTATNGCGSDNCSFTVTVNETPVISACPSNISQCDVYTATWTDPTATGTPAASVVCVPASGSTFSAGTTTVTCTATNSCGSDQCTFTVTVNETPVISACPSNISQCDVYTATWTDPTATGTPAASVVCVPASGSTFSAGTTTVTCTATNSCGSDQCTFTVTINETPVISACPANISQCDVYTATWTDPTATGTPAASVVCVPASGSTFSAGTTTVNCTATNSCGSDQCSFTVTVNETPVISACPSNISQCDVYTATWTDPTATGTPAASVSCSPASGSTFVAGTTTVTCTATNSCGSDQCTFTVTVNETPVISACPANISQCDVYTATWTAPTATGTPAASVSCSPASGSTFVAGTTTVTCTATNSCGSDQCTFTVTINETPVIGSCPSNITTCNPVVTYTDPTATGTPAATVSCTPASGSTFAVGTTTVTCTATNSCGSSSCSFTVNVQTPSTAATSATSTALYGQVCVGGSVTLTANGGSLGTGASWVWYDGGCGSGASVGSGSPLTITPALGNHNYFVRAEGACGNTACVNVAVNVISAPPSNTIGITSAPTDGCVGAPATTVSVNAVANCTFYNWSSSQAGVRFNGNPSPFQTTVPTVNVTFVSLPAAGSSGWSICVFGGNACGNTNNICTWVRATVSMPTSITGSVIGCPGTSGNAYSSSSVAGAASYQWSSTGGIVVTGNGAQAVTVAFPGGFVSGTLSVRGQTACGYQGPNRTMTITASPAIPATISGPSYPCPNVSASYSIAAVPGAANYTWTTSVPGAVVTGTGTSCSIAFPATIPAGSTVSVVANSLCPTSSATRSKGIASGTPGVPFAINGPASGQCGATGVSYTINPVFGATGYSWTASCGIIQGPNNLSGISIDWPGSFTTCTLSVTATNACGTGIARTLVVFGAPAIPASISGNAAPCNGSVEGYSASSVGATSYNWTVPAGATILGPPNGASISVLWGATSGNITVTATNACGTSGVRSLPCVISCRQSQVTGSASGLNAEVYPNPATEKATVKFSATTAAQYHLNMTDVIGRNVLSTDGTATEGINMVDLDLNNLAKGVYMLNIMSGDNNEQIKVVVE